MFSGSDADATTPTKANPAVVILATVVVVNSYIFGINSVGVNGIGVVVVVVDVVVLVNANDAFVVAGCSGMYGYDGQGTLSGGPSIDSNT